MAMSVPMPAVYFGSSLSLSIEGVWQVLHARRQYASTLTVERFPMLPGGCSAAGKPFLARSMPIIATLWLPAGPCAGCAVPDSSHLSIHASAMRMSLLEQYCGLLDGPSPPP